MYKKQICIFGLSAAMILSMGACGTGDSTTTPAESTAIETTIAESSSAVAAESTAPAAADGITLTVDGKEANADIYIDKENGCFIQLEELAPLLANTDSAFDVAVDTNNKKYQTHLGEEYKAGATVDSEAPKEVPENWTLAVDGVNAQLIRSHTSGEKTYFNLRDISALYGFSVTYDETAKAVDIKSGTGYTLELNTDNYETGSIRVYGKEVNYRVYTQVYVSNPQCVAQEVMKIYVPENATDDSPIIMPLKTGAHMHAEMAEPMDVDETNINTVSSGTVGTGGMQAASYLLSEGWIVASAGARGLDTHLETGGKESLAGIAPYCITDLKAAIRFLNYNDDKIPGDPDKIVVTGTSGGGTMTSVLGASGNAEAFEPFLQEIGAADEDDDVFVAVPYCPVADIDNQGPSYEWIFQGIDIENRSGNLKILSQADARTYTSYVNGLNLTDEAGNALTLDPETLDGSYKDYYCARYAEGLSYYMHQNNFVAADGTLTEEGQKYFEEKLKGQDKDRKEYDTEFSITDFFDWNDENGGSASFKTDRYADFLNVYIAKIPIKACPSFDNGLVYEGVDQPVTDSINALFNTDLNDLTGWSHFEMNLGQTVAAANETIGSEYFKSAKGSFEISAEAQKHIAMYNPMYYIQDYSGVASEGLSINSYADDLYQSSDVAPYWYLRVGSWDHLVSSSTETTFSLALNKADDVKECNFRLYWDQPHTGWYDNTDLIQWLTALSEMEN